MTKHLEDVKMDREEYEAMAKVYALAGIRLEPCPDFDDTDLARLTIVRRAVKADFYNEGKE